MSESFRGSWRCVLAGLVFASLFGFCCDWVTGPGTIRELDVQFVVVQVWADLMPIRPDPIAARVELLLKNKSQGRSLTGIEIPSAAVYLASNKEYLGQIEFSTTWDGCLGPGEQDTVRLWKIEADTHLFDPPCGDSVYMKMDVLHGRSRRMTLITRHIMFGCIP